MPEHTSNDEAVAVAEREAPEAARTTSSSNNAKKQPRYNVILLDDNHHTYEYVITMLLSLFGHPFEQGFDLAKKVDNQGRAVVLTTTLEHAELKRDQIHAFGPDLMIASCQGSMSAVIQPVDDDD